MKEWTIDVRIENNHLVTEIDGKLLLIDSGAPDSFGYCKVNWDGKSLDLSSREAPMNFDILRNRIGLSLDGLVGSDLLLTRGMRLDIQNGTITFHDEAVCASDACSLQFIMTVPSVTMDVCGVSQNIIIDTGAMQSFVDNQTAQGLARVGSVCDFMPNGEEFISDLVEMEAVIDDIKIVIQPAISPIVLELLLDGVSAAGIIGLDVLQTQVFEFAPTIGYMSPAIRLNSKPSDEAVTFISD